MSGQNYNKKVLKENKLLLPKQPNNDDFLQVMDKVLKWSCFFGVIGTRRIINYVWTAALLVVFIVIECTAIWKVIKALAGWAIDMAGHRSVTARLAGTIFYSISIISLLLGSKLAYSWKELSEYWIKVERSVAVKLPEDKTLRKRMNTVFIFMTCCGLVEHVISVISTIGFDCPRSLIIKRYVLLSHGFMILRHEYSDWYALPLAFMSTIATLLWNFQDQLIVLVSMGLVSRYRRLNQCVEKVCGLETNKLEWDKKIEATKVYSWRKIREAYVKQSMLVRKVDAAMGAPVLLSCFCNFYFICLQLFLAITQFSSSSKIKCVYYIVSLCWLCIRVCSVVLTASNVNIYSQLALKYLYTYETHFYNIEVQRLLNQLTKDYVALSGMGFFYLSKTLLLQMAGAIITYELVLIQFDDKGSDNLQLNSTSTY